MGEGEKRIDITVSEMALIRHIGNNINALTAKRAARALAMPKQDLTALNAEIDQHYQQLFVMLPAGAERDQPLLDQILAPDNLFWANVNRESISGYYVALWCDELINGEGEVKAIAKQRLLFFFGGPTVLDIYLDKHFKAALVASE